MEPIAIVIWKRGPPLDREEKRLCGAQRGRRGAEHWSAQERLQWLADRGCDIAAAAHNGQQPMHYAASARSRRAMVCHHARASWGVSRCGVTEGRVAVCAAGLVTQRRAALQVWLERRGADPLARAHNGQQPLHIAAHAGDTRIMDWLLQRGADVNVARRDGATAAHFAASGAERHGASFPGISACSHNAQDGLTRGCLGTCRFFSDVS